MHELLNYWNSYFWYELHLFGVWLAHSFIFRLYWNFGLHVLLFCRKNHALVGLLKLMLVECHLLLELLLHYLLLHLKLIHFMLRDHNKWHHSYWWAWFLWRNLIKTLILMMLNTHDHGLNLLSEKWILKRHSLHFKYAIMILLYYINFFFLIEFLIILLLFVFLSLLRIDIDIIILLNYIYLCLRKVVDF